LNIYITIIHHSQQKAVSETQQSPIKVYNTIISDSVQLANERANDKSCNDVLIGDGQCNEENNIEECNYDGGDCCLETCINNCTYKEKSNIPCRFQCTDYFMNCKDPKAGCHKCIHGICKNIKQCFSDGIKVKEAITACLLDSYTMGNSRTNDFYCGKDPDYSIIHIDNTPHFHYPGCGVERHLCTIIPCCDVVLVCSYING
jgi:hypothetical protein